MPPAAPAAVAAAARQNLAALKEAYEKQMYSSTRSKINKYEKEVDRARSCGMKHISEMWDDDARISALLAISNLQGHEAAH